MIIFQNILSIDSGIICHACNCQNKFGKGLALYIKNKFPIVFEEFLKLSSISPRKKLGTIQEVKINEKLSVVNCFTQLYYGYNKDFNDYTAWEKILDKLVDIRGERDLYFPYMVSCGLAGGNWERIQEIILRKLPEARFCKL